MLWPRPSGTCLHLEIYPAIAGQAYCQFEFSPPEETNMAKSQRKGNKEIRKAKKPAPPKPNASNPSQKGTPIMPAKD